MRIDLTYATPALAARVTGVTIERNERKGKAPSDHVPGRARDRRLTARVRARVMSVERPVGAGAPWARLRA